MKAVSRLTGEWYAVKMIHNNKMNRANDDDPASPNNNRAAFAREISILEKLQHPNICQLKETFFQDGNISFVSFSFS
jgi:serine/threonine/tyrosine protein kinase RAD53